MKFKNGTEDLMPAYKTLSQYDIEKFFDIIKPSYSINIGEDIYGILYNRLEREDNEYKIVFVNDGEEIEAPSNIFAISFYDDNVMVASMLTVVLKSEFLQTLSDNNIRIYYKGMMIKDFYIAEDFGTTALLLNITFKTNYNPIARAYELLIETANTKDITKEDALIVIEEVIGYLGEALDD